MIVGYFATAELINPDQDGRPEIRGDGLLSTLPVEWRFPYVAAFADETSSSLGIPWNSQMATDFRRALEFMVHETLSIH